MAVTAGLGSYKGLASKSAILSITMILYTNMADSLLSSLRFSLHMENVPFTMFIAENLSNGSVLFYHWYRCRDSTCAGRGVVEACVWM